jgi:FkbM family methyltransferase
MSKTLAMYQSLARLMAKHYVTAEGPGWGYVYRMFVGHAERDWLWRGAPTVTSTDKNTGYIIRRDLSWWSDRLSYFLGRWYSLEIPIVTKDLVGAGDTVIDIGANRGDFALCASTLVGQAGKVLAFEPNPSCVALFQQTLSANQIGNVRLFQLGLSDSKGSLMLVVPKFSSGEASFGSSQYEDVYAVEACVDIGDDVIGDARPTLIKIDVEGFEVRVLRGLEQTIRSSSPIIVTELVSAHLARCGSSSAELVEFMRGMGYAGFRPQLTDNKRDWFVVELNEHDDGDVIWVRKESIGAGNIFRRLKK